MSQLDDVLLLCEDVDQGVTPRLLEAARHALEQETAFARRVTIRPSGSKVGLPGAIEANRLINPQTFAVRDRDFLMEPLLAEQRKKVFSEVGRPAWPLRRHCIESYLIDPPFIESVLGRSDAGTIIDALAAERQWLDACRATGERLAWESRRVRPVFSDVPPSEEDAIAMVEGEFAKWSGAMSKLEVLKNCASVLREFHADFLADGPLRERVDGKELLTALEAHLGSGAQAKVRLLTQAERGNPPSPLLEELRQLLVGIEKFLSAGT